MELESQLLDGDEVVVDLDGLLDLQQKLDGRRIVALVQQLLKPDIGLLLQKMMSLRKRKCLKVPALKISTEEFEFFFIMTTVNKSYYIRTLPTLYSYQSAPICNFGFIMTTVNEMSRLISQAKCSI